MAATYETLRPKPRICDSRAERLLRGLAPEVLDLVTEAIESTQDGIEIARIELSSSSEPGDTSGWTELVFTTLVRASEGDAFAYWMRIGDGIDARVSDLDQSARKQLDQTVSVEVLKLAD